MKFLATTTLIGTSLLAGVAVGSAMTLYAISEGYVTVEKDETGKMNIAFDLDADKKPNSPSPTEEPPAAS